MLVVTVLRPALVTLDVDNILFYRSHGVLGTATLPGLFLITGDQSAIVV